MWICLTVWIVALLGLSDGFHLQNQAGVRRAVCRRAPPCCPGHVCRAYQRFDASRPVAACARTVDGRPLYAPGSQAQQRVCGTGSRGAAGIGARSLTSPGGQPGTRGLRQFRRSRGPGFDVNPLIGQAQAGGRPGGRISGGGMERDMLGSGSRLSWDQGRSQRAQRFPGQARRIAGQEMLGQGQMGFPEFPPMPSFGDQLSQPDLFPAGLSPEQSLGGQPNTFAQLPGRHGQRSFGGIEDQRLGLGQTSRGQRSFGGMEGLGQTSRGQGQSSFRGQFPPGQGFQPGQRAGGAQASFDQGQIDFNPAPSSLGGQSFSSQTFSGPSVGGQSFGGQSFSGAAFGQLPGSAGGGRAPQPFLVEQPPISATSIVQEPGQTSGTLPQQP